MRSRSLSERAGLALKGFLLMGFLWVSGCALQADLVDLQTDLEKVQEEQARIKRLLEGSSRPEGTLESALKEQSDLLLRVEKLSGEIQTLRGRLEEDHHTLSQLMQRMDEQNFRTGELQSRLQSLESRLAAPTESIPPPQQEADREIKPTSKPPEDKKMVLPGRPPLRGLTPIEVYNLAYNDYLKGNYDLAIAGFESFLKQFPDSTLAPHAVYWQGESYYSKKDYFKAIESFDRLVKDFPKSEKVVAGLLKQGLSYAEIGDKTRARTLLRKVIEEHPLSTEADLAKNKLAEIR